MYGSAELRRVFVQARDRGAALTVWFLCLPANGDRDNEAFVEAAEAHAAEPAVHPHPTLVLMVEPGLPPPNAAWRKRLADSSRVAPPGSLFAFVSKSSVARGVYTAINWLRPPPFKHAAFDDTEQAEGWIERARGPVPALRRLIAEARAAAMLEAAKRTA